MLPGNRLGLRDGATSPRTGAELFPEAAGVLAEREAAIVADLGGPASVSTLRRELVTRVVQASAIADHLGADLIRHGLTTAKGRPRAAVSLFLSVLDRVTRLAQSIGLERKGRDITGLSAAEWAHQAQQHRDGCE